MTEKIADRLNTYFEFSLYLVLIACTGYFLIRPNYAKVFQAVLTLAVLLLIHFLFKRVKTLVFPALRFAVLLFILLAMILAKEFDFYSVIPHLDKIEHLFSGVILAFVGLVIFRGLNGKSGESKEGGKNEGKAEMSLHAGLIPVLFSLFFAVAMAGCWEIYEFSADHLLGFNSQNNSLTDTMGDIICGTIGGAGSSIYLYLKQKVKTKD